MMIIHSYFYCSFEENNIALIAAISVNLANRIENNLIQNSDEALNKKLIKTS